MTWDNRVVFTGTQNIITSIFVTCIEFIKIGTIRIAKSIIVVVKFSISSTAWKRGIEIVETETFCLATFWERRVESWLGIWVLICIVCFNSSSYTVSLLKFLTLTGLECINEFLSVSVEPAEIECQLTLCLCEFFIETDSVSIFGSERCICLYIKIRMVCAKFSHCIIVFVLSWSIKGANSSSVVELTCTIYLKGLLDQ